MEITTIRKIRYYISQYETKYTKFDELQITFFRKIPKVIGYLFTLLLLSFLILLDNSNLRFYIEIASPIILVVGIWALANIAILPFISFLGDIIKLYLVLPEDTLNEDRRASKKKSSLIILCLILLWVAFTFMTEE